LFTTNLVTTAGWSEHSVTPDGERFLVMESSRHFFTGCSTGFRLAPTRHDHQFLQRHVVRAAARSETLSSAQPSVPIDQSPDGPGVPTDDRRSRTGETRKHTLPQACPLEFSDGPEHLPLQPPGRRAPVERHSRQTQPERRVTAERKPMPAETPHSILTVGWSV
jgi:hypothetical protein